MRIFRRDVRLALPPDRRVAARFSWGEDDARCVARVKSIGPRGMQVETDSPLPLFKTLEAAVSAEEAGFDFHSAATACLSKPGTDGDFLVDVRFAEELPHEIIDRLVPRGNVDVREHPRFTVSAAGTISREMCTERAKVRVEDLSRGGFRLRSPVAAEVGRRVMLLLDDAPAAPPILAVVSWQTEVQGEWRIGCRFADEKGYFRLQDHLVPSPESGTLLTKLPRESLWVSAVALAVFAGVVGFLLLRVY